MTVAHAELSPNDPDVGLYQVLGEDGVVVAGKTPRMPDALALRAYREMRRLRLLDGRMVLLQRQGRVGFYGAAQGQEAVPIGTGLVAGAGDWVFPALREQAVMLVRGFSLDAFIAQIFGNSGDVLKGRQMPSHPSGAAVHQVSWSSCIGPQIPQAVGCAMAMKPRHAGLPEAERPVAFGFMGDGATSEPDFHSAMTFAARFRPPAVLVCQNNHWSISVPTARQTASRTLAVKGRAYGIPAVRVDGNDVLAVYEVLSDATARARRGEGPTFVEALTYRMGAHSTSDDPTRYRSDDEVATWAKRDPLERLKRYVYGRGLVTEADDAAFAEATDRELVAAIKRVEALPAPERASLFDDVYAERPWHLDEQRADLLSRPPPASPHG